MVDLKPVADGGGYRLEVTFIGADDQVVAPDGALDDACVNDVRGRGTSSEGADGAGLAAIKGFDDASGQEPGEQGLAAGSAPGLGHDRRWHGGHLAAHEQGAVPGPHPAFTAVRRDERASVVRDAHQALCARVLPERAVRWIAAAAH